MKAMDKRALASIIDHTILKPDAARETVIEYCRQAVEYGFASVCINPCFVKLAADQLKNTSVKVCTVIGFPLGAGSTEAKAYEAAVAVAQGAHEVDIVINIGALKEGNLEYVEQDIRQVVKASENALVKVIIETCYLTDEEKVIACRLAKNAGAHFVKTSTGFGSAGATAADVALMRETVGNDMGVKAAGGIRSFKDAAAMVEAGANRLGTSSGIKIINELG